MKLATRNEWTEGRRQSCQSEGISRASQADETGSGIQGLCWKNIGAPRGIYLDLRMQRTPLAASKRRRSLETALQKQRSHAPPVLAAEEKRIFIFDAEDPKFAYLYQCTNCRYSQKAKTNNGPVNERPRILEFHCGDCRKILSFWFPIFPLEIFCT